MRTPFAEFLVQNGLVSADVAQRTSDWCMRTRIPIGLIAVGHGLISGTNIDDVLEHQRDTCVRFGEAAVEMRLLSQRQVDTLLEIQRFREAAEIAEGAGPDGPTDVPSGQPSLR